MALRIDTLAFANRLKDAGADPRLAEAIVEGLALADISHLVTKADLAGTEAALRTKIARSGNRIVFALPAVAAAVIAATIAL